MKWDILNIFINILENALRIIYKLNINDIKLFIIYKFILLKNWLEKLRFNQISFKEMKKYLKNDIKIYLYFVKKFKEDFDKDFSFIRNYQIIDFYFMINFIINSIKKEENFSMNFNFIQDSSINSNSSEIEKLLRKRLIQENISLWKTFILFISKKLEK